MTRYRDAFIGLLYVALVAALILLSIGIYDGDFGSVAKVSMKTDTIGSSLQKGSDVQVRGIVVGTVSGVHTDGDGARIDMDIQRGRLHDLPANVQGMLLPKTLFGERYVSLELPADPASGRLHGGSVIVQDTSQKAIELQQIFDRLLPVLQAVQPDKLATLLGELSLTLRNRGAELGDTVATFTGYLNEFAPKVPQFTDDIAAFGRVASTYDAAAPDLLTALDDFTVTNQTVAQERSQLLSLFTNVNAFADTTTGVVGVNQRNIIALTNESIPTLQTLRRYSGEFPCLSQALVDFIPTANAALGAGTAHPGLRATARVVPSLGKYTPGTKVTTTFPSICSYAPYSGAASALAAVTGQGADATALGSLNTPAENEVVAEIEAPSIGLTPSAFPEWGSLLLGPLLRGTSVTVR